jgi:uncharacterized protein YuzE
MAIRVGKLWIRYDDASDVLYLSLGKPRPATTEEDSEGILIRKDPKSGETIGVTVLSYGRHFRHLRDVSWLTKRQLPSELLHYLQERPQL